jgi:hypothetical protein
MKIDPEDPQDSPSLAALTALGRDAPRAYSEVELDHGLSAVRARIAAGRARRRARIRGSLLGATAAACAVAALRLASVDHTAAPSPEPRLAVSRIEGGSLFEGGYLSQSGRAGIKLSFNEGSTFELAPGARGRLRAVAEDNVHMAIEDGSAAFQITRSHARRWLIEAGPFSVTVKGTGFTVAWDPASELFELRLRSGRVTVSGPTVGEAMALRAGQRLVVSLPRAETLITEESPEGTSTVTAGPARRAATGTVTAAAPPAAAKKSAAARRWAAALANGRWDTILADVDRDGVEATLETAGSDDLFALADAARYRRRTELARAALLAQRRRFPRAPRSLDAMFLLGRVEELREQGTTRALAWYDAYLSEAPAGAYAAEALGRKMMLTHETQGPVAARPIADVYLRRFPAGSYAGSARALQRVP